MKDKADRRKKLLSGESKLESFAKILYVDRFKNFKSHWWWDSKVEWGEKEEGCS